MGVSFQTKQEWVTLSTKLSSHSVTENSQGVNRGNMTRFTWKRMNIKEW